MSEHLAFDVFVVVESAGVDVVEAESQHFERFRIAQDLDGFQYRLQQIGIDDWLPVRVTGFYSNTILLIAAPVGSTAKIARNATMI